MRHLTFLRVYLPLERLPARIHGLARAAAKLSRADIEAEAAERLNRRLRPDAFRLAPSDSEPPIIRVLEAQDPGGQTHQFFHVEYLARAAYESVQMRRQYFDDTLYDRLVPPKTVETLAKIAELQADAGLISRPVPNFYMQLWNVSLAWLAAFEGTVHEYHTDRVTKMVIDGTPVIHRVRDLEAAISCLGYIHRLLTFYGPDGPEHPYANSVGHLQSWLNRHRGRTQTPPATGLVELDYGALSQHAWPDVAGEELARGHTVLDRAYRQDEEIEEDDDTFLPGLPPAMLNHAAETMRRHYQRAVDIWKRIQRYEYAN